MKKTFLIETRLTVTLRRVFEVEAESAEAAEEMFTSGEADAEPISEETVKVVGDEYVVSTKEKQPVEEIGRASCRERV